MFDWNDLKHFLAVARYGSTIAAGKALGTSQSTVHRRLSELEERIGRELVVRHTAGYRLTDFGRDLLPLAERVEAAVKELERHVADAARDRRGVIRVTCPEPIVPRLMPLIERFHAQHPKFQVEFVTSDRYLDLLKGEADVAFRSGDTDDDLLGRKIADSIWAVYASPAYYRAARQAGARRGSEPPSPGQSRRHAANHRVVKWLSAVAPDAKMAARNNSVLGLVYAVKSGIGVGPLPTAIAGVAPLALAPLAGGMSALPELARSVSGEAPRARQEAGDLSP